MLENGKIEELKKSVQDEIYKKELSATPGAIQRYAAMKRYFKYADGIDKRVSMPCIINDKAYFMNGFTAIKTSESIGDITPYEGEYFNLDKSSGEKFVSIVEALSIRSEIYREYPMCGLLRVEKI